MHVCYTLHTGVGRHGSFAAFGAGAVPAGAVSPSPSPAATAPVASATRYRAVLFDLGGVVVDSPISIIEGYNQELGLPRHSLNKVRLGQSNVGAYQ